MIAAAEIKAGEVLRWGSDLFKVVEAVVHQGGGKSGSMVHLKIRHLSTGHVAEKRLAADEKVEDVPVTRVKMQFLFHEGDRFTFMNPETFDQTPLDRGAVGPFAAYLKENDEITVEFADEKPIAILHPDSVELAVSSTPEGLHGDSTPKEAVLENGLTVLVPQFIKEGDRVHVDVETGKYMDRVSGREVKGAKFTVAAPKQREVPKGKEEPDVPED